MKDNRLDVDLGGLEAKLEWKTDAKQDALIDSVEEYREKINDKSSQVDRVEDHQETRDLLDEIRSLESKVHYLQAKIIYDFDAKGNEMPGEEFFTSGDYPKGQHEYNMMVFRNPSILI